MRAVLIDLCQTSNDEQTYHEKTLGKKCGGLPTPFCAHVSAHEATDEAPRIEDNVRLQLGNVIRDAGCIELGA